MFAAQAVGSAFNIAYNLTHLSPLLTEGQGARLARAIQLYNAVAYPPLLLLWIFFLARLRRPCPTPEALHGQQKRVINLPLHGVAIAGAGWLGTFPVLLGSLRSSGERLNPHVNFHFAVSLAIAAVIALTIGYFLIDTSRQRLLFPYFFPEKSPARIEGTFRLSVPARGWLAVVATSVCPILALLLLLIAPASATGQRGVPFAVSVAAGGILCALIGTVLLGRMVVRPVKELREAAVRVERGDLDHSVNHLRADEFGILADDFNLMIGGLREKEHISSTFGRHVGREIAEILLRDEAGLAGVERRLSVLFADIRGFTTKCEDLPPARAVQLLNLYHAHMTAVIEEHGGIVNQLVGDGLMALFGATGSGPSEENDGANAAIAAGIAMIDGLGALNRRLAGEGFEPVRIGVGVNTGPAVVGTIGSPRRMEFTAIGDTVNTAARIEGMTKETGSPFLISRETWVCADPKPAAEALPPREVRGREHKIVLYAVEC